MTVAQPRKAPAASAQDAASKDLEVGRHFVGLLVAAGAAERSADIFVELRGIGGEDPKSLRGVSRGLSAERIRQLVLELESGPLRQLIDSKEPAVEELRSDVADLLVEVARHVPGSDQAVRDSLARQGAVFASPAGLVRLADILGCHHDMRLTEWTSRAKYRDDVFSDLAGQDDEPRRATVTAIVPAEMPEMFESFINYARKFSRGAGVVAAGQLADRFSQERGVAVTQPEAVAFLTPFAVHLGRVEGDDWFAFFNSANDFLRKAATRVSLFGHCSFELLTDFHRRYNRSLYANEDTRIPSSVLRLAIELAGYEVNGDDITAAARKGGAAACAGRGASETQQLMVRVFRETLAATGGRKSVPRAVLVRAMAAAGIRESTAHIYLGNQGLFSCKKGQCRLADEVEVEVAAVAVPPAAAARLPVSLGGAGLSYPDNG